MEKFVINGLQQLHGSISVKGAKNHALKVFAASILSEEEMQLVNVPEIEDVNRMTDVLRELGATVVHVSPNTYNISTANVSRTVLTRDNVPKLRASIVLLGPMLARFGKVALPHPGGCDFGRRPIDLFIKGLTAMGADYADVDGVNMFTAPNGLQGTEFIFPIISVTCTETLMMAATLASGITVLDNAAREPEIVALADYLNSQGAKITGAGTSRITIEGVERLSAGTAHIIPDRIEALSFIALALANKSELTITDVDASTIATPLDMLRQSGAEIIEDGTSLHIKPWETMQPMRIETREYPGFPTDGQSPFTVLLTQIAGESEVRENIYSNRLFFTDMLNRMGANITMHTPEHISIHGATQLRGKIVESPDLRAGIAMVIAATIAHGTTEILNIYQIDRGYENIDARLRNIGVDIERVDS